MMHKNGVNSIQNGASIIVGKEEKEKKIYYKVNYGNSDTLKSIKLTIFAKGGIKETKTILPGDENLDTANRRYICEVEYNIPVFNAYAVAEVEYENLSSTKAASNKFDIKINNQGDNQGNNPGDNQGEIMYGDVNGDGKIDSFDSISLSQYLAWGDESKINKQNADVNGDGKIDSRDAVLLAQYLAGWESAKLGPQG